jgi:hypothetical protein
MASTLQQIVDQTRSDWLMQGTREYISRLNGALNSSTQTVTLTGTAPVAGMVLTIDAEDIYVITASGAATSVAVRGYNGTTAATHSDLALVYHNQRFTDYRIIRAINDELRSLTSPMNGLFRPKTVSLTPVAGQIGYDLTSVGADFIDVLSVQVRDMTGTITLRWKRDQLWHVERNMPTTDFASGYAIFFRKFPPTQHTLLVTYAATYGAVAAANLATDIGTTTGLQATAEDILPVGAALRLVPGREVPRNDLAAKVTSRPSADVPPSAIARSADGLRILRATRINEERARLLGQYESYANVAV